MIQGGTALDEPSCLPIYLHGVNKALIFLAFLLLFRFLYGD